ncbi:MAG: hypothetical protein ORN98_04190, partial [Alphaproteobacteria bacterium]|nr:hypothetical protein [Alphaproteobacteria bacterium]
HCFALRGTGSPLQGKGRYKETHSEHPYGRSNWLQLVQFVPLRVSLNFIKVKNDVINNVYYNSLRAYLCPDSFYDHFAGEGGCDFGGFIIPRLCRKSCRNIFLAAEWSSRF